MTGVIWELTLRILDFLELPQKQRRKDKHNVRNKVRFVGCLFAELKEVHGKEKTLSDSFVGRRIMDVANATKRLTICCDSPKSVLTLGHFIKQCASLKISTCRHYVW